jgi:hypothetical protein
VQQVTGRGWAEPLALTQRIAHHVERGRKFPGRFQELVADFVHGEDGRWWFLQVRALGGRDKLRLLSVKLIFIEREEGLLLRDLESVERLDSW